MKECFIPKRFNRKSNALLVKIEEIIQNYAADNLDLSVRQLFYRLVAANIVPNTVKQYKNLVALVNDARLAGALDWRIIVDRGRKAYREGNYDNPADCLLCAAEGYTIDKWKDQPFYVEVMVEKQALEGVLTPICEELDVTFMANKGYSSASAFYRSGKRFRSRHIDGKKLVVLYLGDHDPSGIDMTRDVEERVTLLGGDPIFVGNWKPKPLPIDVRRLALNMDQIKAYAPPENPARETDSRHAGYVQKFKTQSSWELDALEPRVLADLVRQAVLSVRDETLWAASLKLESEQREQLRKIAKRLQPKKKKGKK